MKKRYYFVFFIFVVLLCFFFFNISSRTHVAVKNVEKTDKHNNVLQQNDLDLLKEKRNNQILTWGYKKIIKTRDNNQGKGVKIAILDSGINIYHKDLNRKIIKQVNMINVKEPINDDLNHGTAIAGIISAKNNNIGIKGIAPSADIYSAKILDKNGNGTIKNLIKGIDWAIKQDVDIMNLSFGMNKDNPKLKKIIEKAIKSGIIIVASSGNNYIKNADYPARYPDVISVGSIDQNLLKSKFSSKGKIDFSAPGKDILSTNNKGGYSLYTGTSFSTAYITGLIALYISNYPNYKKITDSKHIIEILKKHTENLGTKALYGYGMLKFNW